jgi:type VI secretion system protein ImpC
VPAPSPGQTALLSSIELELAARLRGVLHHPDFQSLEASWRGVDLLVRNFGAEEDLKLFLVDVSKAELAADLQAQEALDSSGLHRLITREADQLPWTIWAGLYTFDASVADVELLGRLAKISADTGAPFFAGASAHLVSCDSFGALPDPSDWKHPLPADARDAWQLLRSLPEAAFLGLALPRFLLRQPYGKESDPVESFPFEEMPADPPHEDYLWGNPALLCAFLIASEFQAEGWEMRPGAGGPVGELPVHKFKADGESKVKPCAEAWLSDRAGDAILKTGLMPVLSIKGRDEVRLPFLRSVAGTPFAIGHGG